MTDDNTIQQQEVIPEAQTGRVAGPPQAGPGSVGALGKRGWLGDIAMWDPKLAWVLLQAGPCSTCNDTGGWEMINVSASFSAGAAGQTVPGVYPGLVESDIWIRKVTYTVRRPNAFAGNVMKAQSDYYNSLNPNIDFTLLIDSYCSYVVASEPTPLENIGISFGLVCPAGLVLHTNSRISANYTINIAVANDLVPTEAIITLHGTRLPRGLYGRCDREQAAAVLQAMGYLDAA